MKNERSIKRATEIVRGIIYFAFFGGFMLGVFFMGSVLSHAVLSLLLFSIAFVLFLYFAIYREIRKDTLKVLSVKYKKKEE